MVVTTITDYVVFGTTTDTKPLTGIATNTLFFEIDSGRTYKFTGGVWSLFSGDNKPETLTNKTLINPTITSINNGGTITVPSGTGTLVTTTANQTISNKTLIAPVISTINNGGTITVPSGTRTLMARDTADTVLSKTFNVNSNTLTATSQVNGDILVNNGTQFLRLARGTNGQLLQSTTTGINWATVTTGGGSGIGKASFDYLIYYSGTQYEALNGTTGAVDYTNTTDAAAVLNSAITAINTAGGGVIQIKGTIGCNTTVILKSLVMIKGAGEGAVIKQNNTRNLTALVDSLNFATLTGGGTSTGVYSVYLENIQIDGNKANNTSTATIGLRYYGYNWHLKGVHIKQCHGVGHYSEWATDPVSPSTGTTMDSTYDDFIINLCDGVGWQMRGPHDTMIANTAIYSHGSTGFLQEFLATKYDGSCEMVQVHIFDCVGKGVDAKGGSLRFRGLTTESIKTSGIGLHQEGSTVSGVSLESYGNATGLKISSGGDAMYLASYIHGNTTDGVEIFKNDVTFSGMVTGNGAKGIVLGDASTPVADIVLQGYMNGHTTANIDWGHISNKAISGFMNLYNNSTYPIPILNESNINTASNSFTYESFADGTGVRTIAGRPLNATSGAKSPFSRKFGQFYIGHNVVVTDGLYQGVNQAIAATFVPDQWEGIVAQYSTGTTTGTRAGINSATSGIVSLFTRTSNPSKKTHLKPTNTTSRFYGGFSSAATIPVTDAPLSSGDSGIIVGWNSTDTNIKIYNNDGTGAAPTATDTGITKPSSWWQYEIISDDAGGTFTVTVYSNPTTYQHVFSTRVPSSTTRLATYDVIENTTTTAVTLQIDAAVLESSYVA